MRFPATPPETWLLWIRQAPDGPDHATPGCVFDTQRGAPENALMIPAGRFLLMALACCTLACAAAARLAGQAPAVPGDRVDFNAQIRPLLSDRCFRCHGPDTAKRKGELRLDLRAEALKELGDGWAVVKPGDPGKSELVRRIFSDLDDDLMPPPDSHLSLSASEKDLLRTWVAQGAEYKSHWSLVPVAAAPVPDVGGSRTPVNPIDAFVRARLAREGIEPAPRASPETLIRRLALNLTGLPPTPAEIDAFTADPSPKAYSRVAERYLASTAYGERMAVDWLDLARYADTYGYQADVERDMWPYRDWVVRAFNDNLPYDRFLTWQLAGDLLPGATRDQRIATAFNRLHRQTNEGGSIEEEFRTEYVADRVNTFGTAMLGLTLECARCHDHKFDPITQRDYFSLFAFFNNIDESGLYSHFTNATPTPALLLWPSHEENRHRELTRRMTSLEARLQAIRPSARTAFRTWLAGARLTPPVPIAHLSFDRVSGDTTPDHVSHITARLQDGPVLTPLNSQDLTVNPQGPTPTPQLPKPNAQLPTPNPQRATLDGQGLPGNSQDSARDAQDRAVTMDAGSGPLPTGANGALHFSGDNSVVHPGVRSFGRTDPFSLALRLKPTEKQERAVLVHQSRAWTDAGSRGFELTLHDGRPFFGLIHFWPGNAIAVRASEPLALGQWSRLVATYDGSSRASGLRIYLDGRPLDTEVVRDRLYKDITYNREAGERSPTRHPLTVAARFRDSGFKNGLIDDLQVFDTALTEAEVAGTLGRDAGQETAFEHFLARHHEESLSLLAGLRALRADENRLVGGVPEIMVMEEMPAPRPAHLLARGSYDAPGDVVPRDTPASLPPFPEGAPRDRLGLARWLTSRQNPLTARVVVNRIWRMHFGRGIVPSQEDFGSQGTLPTHPELLDWLTERFVREGWDVKGLHRIILASETFQRSSQASPEVLRRDPENALLSRGPKARLQAEQIRDSALAAAGLLNRTMGGPSVKPYQPPGLWEQSGTGKTYTQDTGDKLYRRSLYTFWRRTSPPPSMTTFDALSREVCTARRDSTATPLQSLVLLNDPQFVEAARVLAQALVRRFPQDPAARSHEAFRALIGRRPDVTEGAILARHYAEQEELYMADPANASRLLRVGEAPGDDSLPAAEVAATTALTSLIMNFDEFIVLR